MTEKLSERLRKDENFIISMDKIIDDIEALEAELQKIKELRGLEFEQLVQSNGIITNLKAEVNTLKEQRNTQFEIMFEKNGKIVNLLERAEHAEASWRRLWERINDEG